MNLQAPNGLYVLTVNYDTEFPSARAKGQIHSEDPEEINIPCLLGKVALSIQPESTFEKAKHFLKLKLHRHTLMLPRNVSGRWNIGKS